MALLVVAVAAALFGAVRGNHAAWPLLVSVTVGVVLRLGHIPFNLLGWWLMDVLVILGIAFLWWVTLAPGKPVSKWRELTIIAMFGLIWPLYLWQPSWWCPAVELIVAAQLLITSPTSAEWSRIIARWKGNFLYRSQWTELDMRKAA